MQLSFLVAKALLEGDFASYFASLPSADVEPEPIVLREGMNLPRFRLHPYAAFRRRSSSGRLARSSSSGLRYPSAEWVLALL